MRTARKWFKRFDRLGLYGSLDRNSRPATLRTNLNQALCQRIEQLRRRRMPIRRIEAVFGLIVPTVCWLLAVRAYLASRRLIK